MCDVNGINTVSEGPKVRLAFLGGLEEVCPVFYFSKLISFIVDLPSQGKSTIKLYIYI